ncbi:MAG: YfbK domain-containing protein [Nannocystales bacterium]
MFRRAIPTLVLLAIAPGPVAAAAPPLARAADTSAPAWDRPILADPDSRKSADRPPRTFRDHGVGPTIDTAERPRGAFTLDHDTASFDLARAALARGEAPQPAEVRVEEFVKVFSVPPELVADAKTRLGIEVDAVASSHRRGYQVVRVTAYATPQPQRPVDVVVAVDVSPAMATPPDLDEARELVQTLGAALSRDDRIALVELNSPAEVLLPLGPPPSIIDLEAEAKRLGPAEAPSMSETTLAAAFGAVGRKKAGRDRVVVVLGPGSLPPSAERSRAQARRRVWATARDAARRGVATYAVGIGRDTYDDVLLGGLASAGQGAYLFAHEPSDTARRLAQVMRRPIAAADPVLDVEFDPQAVTRYRLLGFEGRIEPAPRREQPTSGALRAGDAVTALYEVKLRDDAPAVWGQASLRYTDPKTGKIRAVRQPMEGLTSGVATADAPERTQLVVLAAAVAEKLRASYWARRITWAELQDRFAALPEDLRNDPDAARLGAMIDAAAKLRAKPKSSGSRSTARPFERMPVVR